MMKVILLVLSLYRSLSRCVRGQTQETYQTPPATWLPLPVSKHIKLAMTKEKGTRYGRGDDELTRQRVKGELEQVMAGKVLVDMDSVFNDMAPLRTLVTVNR